MPGIKCNIPALIDELTICAPPSTTIMSKPKQAISFNVQY